MFEPISVTLANVKPGDLVTVGRFYALYKQPVYANTMSSILKADDAVFLPRDTQCLVIAALQSAQNVGGQRRKGIFLLTPDHGVRWLPL